MRALALLTILALTDASQAGRSVEILDTGSFHGDEVPPDAPGPWFAFVREGTGAALRSVRVTVTLEHDPIVDDDERETTGKRVEISPDTYSIALVRGLPTLKAGPLPTALVGEPIDVGRPVAARLKGRVYQLSHRCAETVVEGERQEHCALNLRLGTREQVLFTYGSYFEAGARIWASEDTPEVHWAGDIDGDGLLDVLLDTSDHYNVREMRLYLSSAARGGALVREAATFTSTGC